MMETATQMGVTVDPEDKMDHVVADVGEELDNNIYAEEGYKV